MKNCILLLIAFSLLSFDGYSQATPIGYPINTSSDEYNPCLSGNGRTLIMEQLYFNEDQSKVYIAYQKGGAWSRPEELPGVNSQAKTINNSSFFLNQNGNIILFSSSRYGGIGGNDIWMMEKTIIGTWSTPRNLAKPINSIANETDPSISPDGRLLYFTRLTDQKTSTGSSCGKIFVSEKVGKDGWKTPVELPSPINKGCDCNAKMLSDSKTLIFSSQREGSIGGYDLYKTKQNEDGSWAEPISMSFINTNEDDKYISVPAGGSLVYYGAPTKTNAKDIVKTKIPDDLQPDKVLLLQGTVKNATNNIALVPKIVITNLRTNKITIIQGALDGSYSAPLAKGDVYDVSISAWENGFSFQSALFKLEKLEKYEEKFIDVKLQPFKPGLVVPLNNTSFVNNTDTLSAFSLGELNRIVTLLKSNITSTVEIGVHSEHADVDSIQHKGFSQVTVDTTGSYTDSTGRELPKLKYTYSNNNTDAQAKAICNYLLKKGIPVERTIPKGYGNSLPLSPPPADKALNRRVELKLIRE